MQLQRDQKGNIFSNEILRLVFNKLFTGKRINEKELGKASYLALHSSCRPIVSDFFDNWIVQVRKGVLELCILRALENEERYGYELVKTLASVPGLALSEGTLYPLLSRLRVAGLISARLEESAEGPARKYYSLTANGRRTLISMNDFLQQLNEGTNSLNNGGKA